MLDKVIILVLLPDDLNETLEVIAYYFEVSKETIESIILDNRVELEVDNLRVASGAPPH